MKNKKLFSAIQLLVGIAILAYLFVGMKDRGDLFEAVKAAGEHWALLLGGFMFFLVCLLLCTFRWDMLLKAQGLQIRFRRVFAVFFVGHFFNSFLFGLTGGDVVKAYYTALEAPEKKTEAVTTVFVDRVIGMLALIMLAVVIMLIRIRFFLAFESMRIVIVLNTLLLLGAVAGLFLVFRRNMFENVTLFRRLEQRTAFGRILRKVYNAFHVCLSHRGLLAKTMIISLLNHVSFVTSIFFLGRAVEVDLPYADYLTVFPIITAVSAVPITPGGLGTREAMSKWLLGALGIPATRSVTLSLLIYGTILAWSLVGGLFYLHYAYRLGKRPPETMLQS